MSDIELAYNTIKSKQTPYNELLSYLDGNPTLKYSTERLKRSFGNSLAYFAENWANVIINSILDRLVLKGFDINDERANNIIDNLFINNNLNLDAQDVHESLQILGEAFLIIEVVDNEIDTYFNDARMCAMFYDADRPKIKALAAKQWTNNGTFINLYYTDRTERWYSETGNSAKSFKLQETIANPLGVIPVFHFRNSRRIIKGELDSSTLSILDAINKLFGDLMVAAEFDTFKMKVFISQIDPGDISVGPDMKLWLPANEGQGQDTEIVEIGGSSLENFLKPITDLANSLAITTRTPRTYFMNSGANLSGEALIVEESVLVKKVEKKQESYNPTWKEVAQYLLLLSGMNVEQNDIVVIWNPVATELPLTNSTIMKNEKDAGIPLVTSARRLGWSTSEIEQLQNDMVNNQDITNPVL